MTNKVSMNWVGLAVTDLARSRRFYEELLGFTYQRELEAPDQATSKLLQIAPPVNLKAVYLTLDGFVLELLHFDREGNPPSRNRPMNEPGFTHLSLNVDNLAGLLKRVPEFGGTVIEDSDVGPAICIRDPDGQLIELLANS